MNSGNFDRIFIYFGILLAIFISGCASLPNEIIGVFDHRQVENSLIRNNDGPTIVVFENGLDGKMYCWNKIIPEISKDSTTFAYNRPGLGNSDPVSTPRDGLHVIDELRFLLKSNGLKPPYVLVGHSLGGLYMQFLITLLCAVFLFFMMFYFFGISAGSQPDSIGIIDFFGISLFLFGSCINTLADYQRFSWKRKPENKGRLYTSGLSNYSMHINYFGDAIAYYCYVPGVSIV